MDTPSFRIVGICSAGQLLAGYSGEALEELRGILKSFT
jgi:hypothetical protein